MIITEYSLLMAVAWSDLFIFITYLLRRRLWFIRLFDVKAIMLLYVGCFLRTCINIEFEAVTEVNLPHLNFIGDIFNNTVHFGSSLMPVPKMLTIIWATGSLIFLIRLSLAYKTSQKRLATLQRNKEIEKLLHNFIDSKHINKISVVVSGEINSPFIAGLWHSVIYLPDIEWQKKKLQVVLKHEYAHYRNYDLTTILLTDIFIVLFWWNFPVYSLKKQLTDILEFKADELVIRNYSPSNARYYCKTLIEFAGAGNKSARNFAASAIESRVYRVLKKRPSMVRQTSCSLILLTFAAMILILSYMFLPQPYYQPAESLLLPDEVVYYHDNGDGTYVIKANGQANVLPSDHAEKLLNIIPKE